MDNIDKNEFLREQLDLLKRKQTDDTVEWQDVADFRSEYVGDLEHRDTVRKGSKLLYEYINAGWVNEPTTSSTPITVDFGSPSDKVAAQKERIKAQTERLENNRWLRELSRDEMVTQYVVDAIQKLTPIDTPDYIEPIHNSREYVLIFGDEHYGAEFELRGLFGDILNAYSPEIFEERMWDLFNQTVEIVQKENIDTLNVFSMGDFSDGCLRVSQLMKLRYGVVDGTIKYSDFICNWLNELTKYVRVKFQMTNGNHTELRQLGQPKGTFTEDNMGKIVAEFIKTRLKDNVNFTYIENPTGYIYAQLACYTILGIHGEVKNMKVAIDEFSRIYNVPIDYLLAGHLHHSRVEEVGINNEVINVPSIIGVDPYSLSLNKTSNASGKLLVFEQGKGKVCEYTLKLN